MTAPDNQECAGVVAQLSLSRDGINIDKANTNGHTIFFVTTL